MDSAKKDNYVVHISEIPASVREADIKQYFKDKLGVDVRVGTIRAVRKQEIPLQWARVDFRTPEAYERAIEEQRFPTFVEGHSSRLLPNDREILTKDIAEKNLFVKGLDKVKYDHEELFDIFKQFGDIDACKLSKTVKKEDNKIVSKSNGYGFVKFRDSDKAKEVLEKAKFEDPNIVVEPYLKERKKPLSNNLYVRNFSEEVTEVVLKEIFERFGEITSVKVMADETTGKKFGFVCFKDEQAAKDALDMNGSAIEPYSDSLFVVPFESKTQRRDHLQKKYKKQNLFVRNFGENVTEKDLKDLFSQYGNILNTKLLTKKTLVNGEEKEVSQCKGFVCFDNPETAKRAVDESRDKGIWFDGKRLNVSLFEPRSERATQGSVGKGGTPTNPEINDFIMNFLQSMTQGGMMGGLNFMGAPPPMPGGPMPPPRANYPNKPPQPRGPRADMYGQRPGPQPGMQGIPQNPNFNPNMMGPNMHMMGQPDFNQMKMQPNTMGGGMMPPGRGPMPPMRSVSEDAMYSNQYNDLINSADYHNSGEDDKRNKFGDFIYPFVEKVAGPENAPKITGMIIDLELPDLEGSTSTLASLRDKIREGMELLAEEENE